MNKKGNVDILENCTFQSKIPLLLGRARENSQKILLHIQFLPWMLRSQTVQLLHRQLEHLLTQTNIRQAIYSIKVPLYRYISPV